MRDDPHMTAAEGLQDRRRTPRQLALDADVHARTRAAIAERLRPVCPHFPAAEFEALVTRAATIELKYRALSTDWVRQAPPKPIVS